MIDRLEINGVHVDVDEKLRKYVTRKIGKLQRLVPARAKRSAHARVFLSMVARQPTCEVIIELPGHTISAKEATVNMFSSIDVVEAKLARQLRKYKITHTGAINRKLIRRIIKQRPS